ncbi:alkene reductase [Promicromonospora sukumoe]
MSDFFSPLELGPYELANRLVMSPMTRSRAGAGEAATELMAEYYRQRATAGLIVSEAIQPSTLGQAYPATPGLHTLEQVASWRQVTDAVHEAGGLIFAQIMHGGRAGRPEVRGGRVPKAPSSVAAPGRSYTPDGMRSNLAPEAMTEDDIHEAIDEHAAAARNAIAAGFDGVELHGANGYLVQQFLCQDANVREDEWGGSTAGRIRFAVETVRAMADAVGAERTALRVSPASSALGIREAGTAELYRAMLTELAGDGLAFLDIIEEPGTRQLIHELRQLWPGVLMLNPHRDNEPMAPHEAARDAVDDGGADLVSLGRAWLANPDLIDRIDREGPYTEADPATFYGGSATGYTDYPPLAP